jgi:hypothetical protein
MTGENEERGMYRYTLSFNGARPTRYQPDVFETLGVEPLDIELGPYGQIRVNPCRVTNGCPEHFTASEILRWNTDQDLPEKITAHERNARLLKLAQIGPCLLDGRCAERDFMPYGENMEDPRTNPPWQDK